MDVVQDFCNNLIDSIPEGWIPAEWIADQDSRVNVGVTIASVGVLLTLTLLRWILSGSDDVQQETERTQAAASSSSMSSSWLSSKKKGATFTVSKVFNYPIKSCSVEHPQLEDDHFDRLFFNARGVANDRKWMIIDEQNRFITQRQQPRMVRIEPRIKVGQQGQDDVLELTAKGQGSITVIPAKESDGNIVDVEVWSSKLEAIDEGDEVADFLTQFLGTPARLVRASSNQNTSKRDFKYLPEHPNDEGVTPVPGVELKEKKAKGKSSSSSSSSNSEPKIVQPLSFVDSCSLLLVSDASLKDLNSRLVNPISLLHFRPNIVISGSEAFEEDLFSKVQIGNLVWNVVCRKKRCILTTVVPHTGVKSADGEPFKTLLKYRRIGRDSRPSFGIELCLAGFAPGVEIPEVVDAESILSSISVDDKITVLEWSSERTSQ